MRRKCKKSYILYFLRFCLHFLVNWILYILSCSGRSPPKVSFRAKLSGTAKTMDGESLSAYLRKREMGRRKSEIEFESSTVHRRKVLYGVFSHAVYLTPPFGEKLQNCHISDIHRDRPLLK